MRAPRIASMSSELFSVFSSEFRGIGVLRFARQCFGVLLRGSELVLNCSSTYRHVKVALYVPLSEGGGYTEGTPW